MAKKQEKPVYRKATMNKSKNFSFGQTLSKDAEILVREEFIGHGRYKYMAIGKSSSLEYALSPSEFTYTEDEQFVVLVTRISYASKNIIVNAKNRKDAERLANEQAGNLEFSEHDAEYKIDSVIPKPEHLKKFPDSDIHK